MDGSCPGEDVGSRWGWIFYLLDHMTQTRVSGRATRGWGRGEGRG
ncbi:hypothetical protein E2C01_098570 [Portunus trituberculatus]|uniref:Uncharacterized protein n=1 Tax=Portunus trituberculatus TaxID=210409 RepID=A0A5B7K1J5_PORTR|nr:hypothetical protein [Portunus trituberculatus]